MTKAFVFAMLACFSMSVFAQTGQYAQPGTTGWPKIRTKPGPTQPKMMELARFPNDPMPKPTVPPPRRALVAAAVAKISCMKSGSLNESVAVFTPDDVQSFTIISADKLEHKVSVQSEAIDRALDSACTVQLSELDLATKSVVIPL